MSELPEPLTPPDCDLMEFGFMPLEVGRLRDSAIVDEVSGDEFRAAVLLWCASWHQIPAGSLPDNDVQLAKLAGYGRVLREWAKVKSGALYGFIKCSDGRLYHPTVCEKALEAHATRKKASTRGHAGASKRWGDKNARSIKSDSTSIACATENHSKGQERRGEEVPLVRTNGREAAALLPPTMPKPAKPDDPWKEVYDYGKSLLGPSAGGIITNLKKTFDNKPRKVLAKLQDAAERRNPAEWINAFLFEHGPAGIEVGAVHPLP